MLWAQFELKSNQLTNWPLPFIHWSHEHGYKLLTWFPSSTPKSNIVFFFCPNVNQHSIYNKWIVPMQPAAIHANMCCMSISWISRQEGDEGHGVSYNQTPASLPWATNSKYSNLILVHLSVLQKEKDRGQTDRGWAHVDMWRDECRSLG